MNKVIVNPKARKQLKKLPKHIVNNFKLWMTGVNLTGIEEMRKIPGYHDKQLHGNRTGQRSIRLSKAYRAFYIEREDKITIEVIEVNNHEY